MLAKRRSLVFTNKNCVVGSRGGRGRTGRGGSTDDAVVWLISATTLSVGLSTTSVTRALHDINQTKEFQIEY